MRAMNERGAMQRRLGLALMTAVALAVAAQTAWAAPQEGRGGSGQRSSATATRRARVCADCSDADSLRRAREVLLMKVDSLRWEAEHRHLSESERRMVAAEMSRTIRSLETAMEMMIRQRTEVIAAETEAAIAAGRAAQAYTYVEAKPSRARVKGYLGVTFDGPWAESGSRDERVIRFYQYPRIALVEAASPAERAGVVVGDTLLALNGSDVREREVSFTKLLVPNSRITMRVRRDGNARDLRVTVGETPEYYVRRLSPVVPPRAPRVASAAPTPPAQAGQVRMEGGTPAPQAVPAPAQGFVYWFGNDALAGARLETVSGGLARALKVSEGVLVIRTAPGSLAYESGLREGDVVTHVGSVKVRSVSELQQRIASVKGDDIRLKIVRDRKSREVRLRW